MSASRRSFDQGNAPILIAAGTSEAFASYLAFVIYARGSWLYFPVSLFIIAGLVLLALFFSRAGPYFLLLWSLIGAVSQVLGRSLPGRVPILAMNLVAAALTVAYVRGRKRGTRDAL